MALRYQLILLAVVVVLPSRILAAVPPTADEESNSERKARWFLNRETITQTLQDKRYVTQYSAWSCVVVEPSVPPCRHVRQLDIHSTRTNPVMSTAGPTLDEAVASDNGLAASSSRQSREQAYYNDHQRYGGLSGSMDNDYYATPPLSGGWVQMTVPNDFSGREAANAVAAPMHSSGSDNPANAQNGSSVPAPQVNNIQGTPTAATPVVSATVTSEVGWAEWLGFRPQPITVITTVTSVETTKFVDPDTVVTFSFRGCKPSKLPFDMPFCHDPTQSPYNAPPPPPDVKGQNPGVEILTGERVRVPVTPTPAAQVTTAADVVTPAADKTTPAANSTTSS